MAAECGCGRFRAITCARTDTACAATGLAHSIQSTTFARLRFMRAISVSTFLVFAFTLVACAEKSKVESIERAPHYQDAALLEQAWSLPVAATYRRAGFAFQETGSLCGMASTNNALRCLGLA